VSGLHPEAWQWVMKFATDEHITVLDIGGRDINGSPRILFPNAVYTVLDLLPGKNVHIVADAATWNPPLLWDLVLATEVFEHTPDWPKICATAWWALRPGGRFVVTTAGPGRLEHSGIDGMGRLHPGEWYQNIEPGQLEAALKEVGFVDVVIDQQVNPPDVRAVARKAG
jgi:SAM-dependent methyltransferase